MKVYLGINFAKDYNESFADFKERFGSNHIFNNIHPTEREQELRKAYKIATDGNLPTTNKTVKKIKRK
jgi:hypothetical protein